MGNAESTPSWATRAYRKLEPTLPTAEASLLVPFATKPPLLSPGWFADKLSTAFVLSMRSLTPTAFTYLLGWGVSVLAGNTRVQQFLLSHMPPQLLDILVIAARKTLLLLFSLRKYAKKVLLAIQSILPSVSSSSPPTAKALSSPIAATSTLAKLQPVAVFPSIFSIQGILERTMSFATDTMRALLPSSLARFLPSHATISTLASVYKWTFRTWCISEALFYFYFLNRKNHLNSRSIPEDIPPTPAMRRAHIRRLLNHIMSSGKCPILFIREWFNGAEFKDIRHQNLREWAAGAFFNKAVEECSREEILEMDDTVKYIQRATGLQAHQGYNSRVTSIRFTLDPIRVLHRPLVFYTSLYAAAKIVGDTLLRRLGFVKHQGPFFTYWHRPASNKEANQAARRYAQRYGFDGVAAATSSASEADSDHEEVLSALQRKRTHAVHIPREKRVRALRKYHFPKQNVVEEDLEEDTGVEVRVAAKATPGYSAYSEAHRQVYESDSEAVGSDDNCRGRVDNCDDSGDDSDDEDGVWDHELVTKQGSGNGSGSGSGSGSGRSRKNVNGSEKNVAADSSDLAGLRLRTGDRGSGSGSGSGRKHTSFAPEHLPSSSSSSSSHHSNTNTNTNTSAGSRPRPQSSSSRRSSRSRGPPRSHLPFSARVEQAEADEGAIVFVHGIGVGVWTYYLFIAAMVERFPNKDIFLPELDYVSMRLSEYVPSARQGVSGLRLMLLSQGFARAIWAGHSYGTFVVGHCLRFEPALVEHVIQIDPVCFLIHQMDGPFQFLFAPPSCAQARLIHFIAQTEIGVVHTLSRRLWWYQSIVWEDHLPSGSAVVLSAKDTIVPSASVRHYLQHSSHRIRLLWFEELPHAGFVTNTTAIHQILDCIAPYRPPHGTKPIPRPPRVPCARPCPAADVVYEPGLLSPSINDLLCPPALTPGPTEIDTPGTSTAFLFPNSGTPIPESGNLSSPLLPCDNIPSGRSCSYVGIDEKGNKFTKSDTTLMPAISPLPSSASLPTTTSTTASASASSSTSVSTSASVPVSGSLTGTAFATPALLPSSSTTVFSPVPSAAAAPHKRCPACPATCVSACCVQTLFNPYTPVRVPVPADCDDMFGDQPETVDLLEAHNTMQLEAEYEQALTGGAGRGDSGRGVVSSDGKGVDGVKLIGNEKEKEREMGIHGRVQTQMLASGSGMGVHGKEKKPIRNESDAGKLRAKLENFRIPGDHSVNRDSYWCSRLQDKDMIGEEEEEIEVEMDVEEEKKLGDEEEREVEVRVGMGISAGTGTGILPSGQSIPTVPSVHSAHSVRGGSGVDAGVIHDHGSNVSVGASRKQQYVTTVQTYQPVVSTYSTLKHLQQQFLLPLNAVLSQRGSTAGNGNGGGECGGGEGDVCVCGCVDGICVCPRAETDTGATRCGPPPRPLCVIRVPSPSQQREYELDTPVVSRETSPVR